MAQRTLDIILCPDRFLKHKLHMISLKCYPESLLLFIFLLEETKMAQNNSVFVFCLKNFKQQSWKTKLKNYMKQVKIWNHWVSHGIKQQVSWESPQVLWYSHISATVSFVVDGVAKLIIISVVIEIEDHLHKRYEDLCFQLPSLHLLYCLTLVEQIVVGFHL